MRRLSVSSNSANVIESMPYASRPGTSGVPRRKRSKCSGGSLYPGTISMVRGSILCQFEQKRVACDDVALTHVNGANRATAGRFDAMFHFHRFENDEQVMHCHIVAVRNGDFYDFAGHWRGDASVCAAVRSMCASIDVRRIRKADRCRMRAGVIEPDFAGVIARNAPYVCVVSRGGFHNGLPSLNFNAQRNAHAADAPRSAMLAQQHSRRVCKFARCKFAFLLKDRFVEPLGQER